MLYKYLFKTIFFGSFLDAVFSATIRRCFSVSWHQVVECKIFLGVEPENQSADQNPSKQTNRQPKTNVKYNDTRKKLPSSVIVICHTHQTFSPSFPLPWLCRQRDYQEAFFDKLASGGAGGHAEAPAATGGGASGSTSQGARIPRPSSAGSNSSQTATGTPLA